MEVFQRIFFCIASCITKNLSLAEFGAHFLRNIPPSTIYDERIRDKMSKFFGINSRHFLTNTHSSIFRASSQKKAKNIEMRPADFLRLLGEKYLILFLNLIFFIQTFFDRYNLFLVRTITIFSFPYLLHRKQFDDSANAA